MIDVLANERFLMLVAIWMVAAVGMNLVYVTGQLNLGQAGFLAIALVLVYVGAVMVLFLFVIMMLDINLVRLREGFGEYLPIGGLVAVLLLAEMVIILSSDHFSPAQMPDPGALPAGHSNTRELRRLFPSSSIVPERFCGLVKSWIAIRGFPAAA